MKTVIGIVILGVVVGGIYFLNDFTRTEDGKSLLHVARELEISVETAQPEQRGIIRTVQAPGEVEACAEVDISLPCTPAESDLDCDVVYFAG